MSTDTTRAPRSARSATKAVEPPVSWRDGVFLTGSSIWCDARRRRDVCFASSALGVTSRGHGQLIATPITMTLLGATNPGQLAVPVRKPFTLGKLKLELFPSGAALGAAALRVDFGDRSVVYASAVQPGDAGVATMDAGEVRRCDALVVDAPYGDKRQRLVSPAKAVVQLQSWVDKQIFAKRTAVVFVDNSMRALDVLRALTAAKQHDRWVVAAHRSIRLTAQRGATVHLGLLVPPLASATRGNVIVWPLAARAALLPLLKQRSVATLWLSGEAHDKALVAAHGVDFGLAWAAAADRDALLEWIAASRAQTVYVTGRCATTVAQAIGGTVLGPPEQMRLF